jgi:hypothetical protein
LKLAVSLKTLFVETVRSNLSLPALLRDHAADVKALEKHQFDESYIEFLDTQIRLSPRGPKWTERLKARRAALAHLCGIKLLRGTVYVGAIDFDVEIHPQKKIIVHWEEYSAID